MDLSKISIIQAGCLPVFRDKRLMDLYYHTLINSSIWDQALGYFRLSSFRLLSYPLAKFILQNKGKIRVFCNAELSKEDYEILSEAKSKSVENFKFFADIASITTALENKDEKLFSDCISFLIQQERFEIKVLVKKDNARGIAHQKVGIFKDDKGNTVTISGSANASEQGYQLNREDMTASCSFWNESASHQTIKFWIEDFDKVFKEGDEQWQIFTIDSKELKEKLCFRKIDENDLFNDSRTFFERNKEIFSNEIQQEIELELAQKEIPAKFSDIDNIINDYSLLTKFNFSVNKLRKYQIDAIENWKNNNFKGIFAMATGTGKTYTAFGAISMYLKENPKTIIFICCPYQHLIEQWGEQIETFGVKPILVYSKEKWNERLSRALRQREESKKPIFIVATNLSLMPSSDFYEIMKPHWKNTLFIADEAHNLGSGELKKALPSEPLARIGLSATIDRYFDLDGTDFLKDYFGGIIYELPLKDAIGKYLVNYEYFPIPVPLTQEEFEKYLSLSKQIENCQFSTSEESEEKCKKLLMLRARVTNNSVSKTEWLRNNIKKNQELSFTLFYVGDERFQETIDMLSHEKAIVASGFYGKTTNRKEILNEFSNQVIKCLVAMKCLDEGVDIPATRVAYFLSNSGNPKEFIQRRGRVLRKSDGKTKAVLYDLVSVPPDNINKNSESYKVCQSALKSQFKRIREFASLATNRYGSLNEMKNLITKFNLLNDI